LRNAALILGLIGGLMGLFMGVIGYGYTSAINAFGEVDGLFTQVADVQALRTAAVLAPILGLAGAGMALSRALWGGLLMLASVAGMYFGFGINAFTLFPISFTGVAALLALAAGRPDEPQRHF
jgi:hypothetical protein|tara:strand:- start:751 stop:1119 length:369 start_codon:yes stop_codon:yes gene_type:complete